MDVEQKLRIFTVHSVAQEQNHVSVDYFHLCVQRVSQKRVFSAHAHQEMGEILKNFLSQLMGRVECIGGFGV